MKSLLFRLYLAIMKLLARFQRENPQAWVILNGAGRGGSNGYLFYKYLKREHPELDVSLIEPWPSSHLPSILNGPLPIGARKKLLKSSLAASGTGASAGCEHT